MGARELFYWAPTSSSVVSDTDIVKRDTEDDLDWIREQVLDLYYLNAPQSVSAKI